MTTSTGTDWAAWQNSWDRQQEWYMPDREDRFRIMLDMVEALVGTAPRVLDLACGTGSITARLLARFPEATSTGVDLDPALLAIARGTFEGDDRVSFVTADLKDPDWATKLPYESYDAVLTATALHWLHSEPLADLYGRIAELVRLKRCVHKRGPHDRRQHAPDQRGRARPATRPYGSGQAGRRPGLGGVVAGRGEGPGARRADRPPLRDLRRARRR